MAVGTFFDIQLSNSRVLKWSYTQQLPEFGITEELVKMERDRYNPIFDSSEKIKSL